MTQHSIQTAADFQRLIDRNEDTNDIVLDVESVTTPCCQYRDSDPDTGPYWHRISAATWADLAHHFYPQQHPLDMPNMPNDTPETSITDLANLVHTRAIWSPDPRIHVAVIIVDVRKHWDRVDYLVTPIEGTGQKWVAKLDFPPTHAPETP